MLKVRLRLSHHYHLCNRSKNITTYHNIHNKTRHEIFTFKVDTSREKAILQQINMHGGLNKVLVNNGHCPLESCKQAIEKAFHLGLICKYTYQTCIDINKKANKAKHCWSIQDDKD